MTLDISGSSVMVIAEKCPPKGARIQMTILVTRPNGSDCSLELHGEGIVVRIQRRNSTRPSQRLSGFAASVHFYSESSNDSEDWITILPSRISIFTAGRADENSDRAELFRRSRRSVAMNRIAKFVAILGLLVYGAFASPAVSQTQASNTWSSAGQMTQARTGAAAVLLTTDGY